MNTRSLRFNRISIMAVSILVLGMLSPAQEVSAVAAPAVCTGVNMVENGDFETPTVTVPDMWDIFPEGTPTLSWGVEWRADAPAVSEGVARPVPANVELQNGLPAASGSQFTELDTDWVGPAGDNIPRTASARIYQDFVTDPSAEYDLSFAFAAKPGHDASQNILLVHWDGILIDTISAAGTSPITWTYYQYDNLSATGPTTRLSFTDGGESNSQGTFVDDVSLTCTITPTTGGNGGNGGSNNGSATPISRTSGSSRGSVRGDSTNIPAQPAPAPSVSGAVTQLPRTGTSVVSVLLVAAAAMLSVSKVRKGNA